MGWDLFSSNAEQYIMAFGFLLLSLVGGFLLVRSQYHFSTGESFIIGIGISFCLVITLMNLASHWLNLQWAYSLAAGIIFILGFISYKFSNDRHNVWRDGKQAFLPLLILLFLFLLFLRINQGLAIFDENFNLPIISRIAAGDVPPHFPFDPTQPLAYHYGLHLIAGVGVKIGGLSPWFAFDAVRAFTHALLLILAFYWFKRQGGQFWSAIIGACVVYFGGNTQWLLLFMPKGWIDKLNAHILLTNTAITSGKTLADLLVNNWRIDGLGVVSFPFIFIGGLFKPQNLALTSNGACVAMTVFLLLLLIPRNWQLGNIAIVSLILGSLALTAEYLFGLIALGSGLIALLIVLREKNFSTLKYFTLLWIPALGLALFGGGVISIAFQHFLQDFVNGTQLSRQGGIGFEWQLPPSLPTLYFGRLSLIQVDTLLFSLILLCPILFLIPLTLFQLKRHWKSLCLIEDGLLLGAAVSFLLSLLIGLKESVGGITRLLDTALLIFLILSFPLFYSYWKGGNRLIQVLIALDLILLSIGGIAIFNQELLAVSSSQYTTFIDSLDVHYYSSYWNRLPIQAQIFDSNPARSVVIFGRSVGTIASDYEQWYPKWKEISINPTPDLLVKEGYTHAYIDKRFWFNLSPDVKAAWQEKCVRLIDEQDINQNFRKFYDLRACR